MVGESTGGIESHLADVYAATTAWLEWEDVRQQDEATQRIYLDSLSERGLPHPEQPEPLQWLRRLRRFNFTHMPYPGGYLHQPSIFMQELHTTIESEHAYRQIKRANEKLKRTVIGQNNGGQQFKGFKPFGRRR